MRLYRGHVEGEIFLEFNIATENQNQLYMNGKSNPCRIIVNETEGDYIPHFHFIFKRNGKRIDGCMMIAEARYFSHGTHKDTMINSELRALDDWMDKRNQRDKTKTNWEYIKDAWNFYHPDFKIKIDKDNRPKYVNTVSYK